MKAVVVGAGLGGLAAAIRLRARGHEVVVLEATDQPGGRASVFARDGFTWDAGPTVVTAPYLFDELFALGGADRRDVLDLVPVDPFYRVRFADGSTFDLAADEEALLAEIARIHPPDVDGYRRLAAHCRAIFSIGYEQLADAPFDSVLDMLRVAPAMLRLRNDRSVYDAVSRHLRDERLRQAFTFQPLLIGGNPFRASSIYLLIHWLERRWGVHWVRGGTGALVRALVERLEAMGVDVRTGTPVDAIDVRDGAVRGVRAGGVSHAADLVVANADPAQVHRRLLDPSVLGVATRTRLRHLRSSMGLFVTYFGARGRWPDVAQHTIVLGPRYRELLADIFDRRVLARDFSLYLHRPAWSDASLAPPGCEAFMVLSPVPNTLGAIDWETEGPRYRERILAHLDATVLPGLLSRLVTATHVTPVWFREHLRSADGAGFGPEPTLTQSAWFRWHNRSEDVAGLYFVGAGTHPGAGLPGVLSSARVLDRLIPPARTAA